MVKEATTCGGRKCSHCGHNGHNSRTCNGKGCVKLFGVYVSENSRTSMKKSSSADNMRSSSYNKSSELAAADPPGYLSDDPNHHSQEAKAACERKKGVCFSFLFQEQKGRCDSALLLSLWCYGNRRTRNRARIDCLLR